MDQSGPFEPFKAFHQSSIPEVISNTTILANEYTRRIPTIVDAGLCKYCRKLTADVLADPVSSSSGWETMRSEYFSLSCLKEHQDGTIGSLLQSAKEHCKLCALIAQELQREGGHLDLDQVYHIFVWIPVPKKCEFCLSLGDVSRFLQDIGRWDSQPIRFAFFRRNGCDTNWSCLNKQLIFRDGFWPPLPAWPNQFPDSEEAIQRAQFWLSECVRNHKKCSRSQSVLPSVSLILVCPKVLPRSLSM